ncbi:MAG: NYN domain-containing protein [Acidimicrobiales bacterium]
MTPELDLLRPALEMAVVVARQGEAAPLPTPAPRPIRPFLRFARLPSAALAATRSALDDDEFRARVADRSDEEEVGRAGWLLLTRPDGWEDELAALVEQRAEEVEAQRSHDADARSELERARERLAAADRSAAEHRREIDRLQSARDADERTIAELRRSLDEAADASKTAAEERARAVRELKEMERRLAERTAELRALRAAGAGAPEPVAAAPAPDPLQEIRAEWRRAADALDRFADLLADDPVAGPTASSSVPTSVPTSSRRRPVRLERGLTEGSEGAARWLLGRPGAVALVDGYNVSMLTWPDLDATGQRTALERAAAQLQVRTGAQVTLVFDGEASGGPAVRTSVGSPVRVHYSDADTEADDVILDMIGRLDAPVVVVVSNDRRVRDGARERGANVVGSTEFAALLR